MNFPRPYVPPGATLAQFIRASAPATALIGPMHGGRRTCAVNKIVNLLIYGQQRRWRWIVVRSTQRLLDDETIPAWFRWVPMSIGQWEPRQRRFRLCVGIGEREHDLDLSFYALDIPAHRSALQNLSEISGVWLDGARELEESELNRALDLAGSWPPDEPPNPVILVSSRCPTHDSHWLVQRKDFTLFRQPGGRSPRAENLKNLKGGQLYYTRAAEGRSPERVQVEIDAAPLAAAQASGAGGDAEVQMLRDEIEQ